jgi:NAD(P) transhydrogenase subunit alpha
MTIGILKEPSFESRVSMLATEVAALTKNGTIVWVEQEAGLKAFCKDEAYAAGGALIKSRTEIFEGADILLGIHYSDMPFHVKNKVFIGVYHPLYHQLKVENWITQELTVFSLDMLPRTTRAQSMDVLSSQSSIAGYKAAILAASLCPHYFPMMMTAAGSCAPAKILVLGAGVAGLQAVATCRRLGAVVEVFDTRAAAKEEVMSLGATFVEVEGIADDSKAGGYAVDQSKDFQERQKLKIAESIKKADVVIATAQIFGKKAPVLVTQDMISTMRAGSLIIDLAASTGGNTEVTADNVTTVFSDVSIIGAGNLAAAAPADASKLYGRNVLNFLKLLINKEGTVDLNFADDIINSTCITSNGKVISPLILKNQDHGNIAEFHSEQH